MDETCDAHIARIADGQYGVFTLAQTAAIGFSRDQRQVRLAAGRWRSPYPGVYRIAGLPVSWQARVLAACWGARGLAAASHRSAAEVRGMPGGGRGFVEITCHRWRRAKAHGLVVHETRLLREQDLEIVAGIPVVTVEQTLLGLAAVTSKARVEIALDHALRKEMTTPTRLEQFVREKSRQGRNGIGVLRTLLQELDPLARLPESAMETRLKQILRRHGFPTPQFQYEIWHEGRFVARVDAAYPELRIAIEYDSYEHHTGKLALVRDTDRRNRLLRIGWPTVTFTAADIRSDGGDAIEALRAARRTSLTVRGRQTLPKGAKN
jgi:very-short-patch-repair endonuclease